MGAEISRISERTAPARGAGDVEQTPIAVLDRRCEGAKPAANQAWHEAELQQTNLALGASCAERKHDIPCRRPVAPVEQLQATRQKPRRPGGRHRATRGDLERRIAELTAAERSYRALAEAGALILWRADASGVVLESRGWETLTGQGAEASRDHGWLEVVHPVDRPSLIAAWTAAIKAGRSAMVEYRVRTSAGLYRWVRSRAVPVLANGEASGSPVEWVGVTEDIDDQRCAEDRRELLAREVDHRAKNALAVVQAVLRLTRSDNPKSYAQTVEGRVAAIARAHSLLAASRWSGADLHSLLKEELTAYRGGVGRIVLEGPSTALAPAAAQALSMALHELATNAAKYGALSVPAGRLSISWQAGTSEGVLRLHWVEMGGPPILHAPRRRGFGSRVVEATVRDQLGGKVEHRWEPTGFVGEIEVPLARALANAGPDPAGAMSGT
jgi:PAS domain S-box-containing protein